MTRSPQDLMLTFILFLLYCLRRFCEKIIRNGYQWTCLVVSKCYLNLCFDLVIGMCPTNAIACLAGWGLGGMGAFSFPFLFLFLGKLKRKCLIC